MTAAEERSTVSVLLTDDDADLRMLAELYLRPPEWSLVLAVDGDRAVAAITRPDAPFDVLVLDDGMPGTRGVDVMRIARDHGFAGPVIVWSAHVATLPRERLADLGAAIVEKVDLPDLVDRIRAAVDAHRAGD